MKALLIKKINNDFKVKIYREEEYLFLSFLFSDKKSYIMETFSVDDSGESIAIACVEDVFAIIEDTKILNLPPLKKEDVVYCLKLNDIYDNKLEIISCFQLNSGCLIYYYDGYFYYHLDVLTFDKKIHAFCTDTQRNDVFVERIAEGFQAKKIKNERI